jgi:hypothetical protein
MEVVGDSSVGPAAARRRKTAAERRAQRSRAQARAVSHILAGFMEITAHRGNAVSRTASTFVGALRFLRDGGSALALAAHAADEEAVATSSKAAVSAAHAEGREEAASSATPSVSLAGGDAMPIEQVLLAEGCENKVAKVFAEPDVVLGDDKGSCVTLLEGDHGGKAAETGTSCTSAAAASSSSCSSRRPVIELFGDVQVAKVDVMVDAAGADIEEAGVAAAGEGASAPSSAPAVVSALSGGAARRLASSSSAACAADTFVHEKEGSGEAVRVPRDERRKVAKVIPPKAAGVTKDGNMVTGGKVATSRTASASSSSAGRSFIGLFDVGGGQVEHTAPVVSAGQTSEAIRSAEAESVARRLVASESSSVWSSQEKLLSLACIFDALRDMIEEAGEEERLSAVQLAILNFNGTPLSRFASEEKRAIRRVVSGDLGMMTYTKLLGFLRKADRHLWRSHQQVDRWREMFC